MFTELMNALEAYRTVLQKRIDYEDYFMTANGIAGYQDNEGNFNLGRLSPEHSKMVDDKIRLDKAIAFLNRKINPPTPINWDEDDYW